MFKCLTLTTGLLQTAITYKLTLFQKLTLAVSAATRTTRPHLTLVSPRSPQAATCSNLTNFRTVSLTLLTQVNTT